MVGGPPFDRVGGGTRRGRRFGEGVVFKGVAAEPVARFSMRCVVEPSSVALERALDLASLVVGGVPWPLSTHSVHRARSDGLA